MNLLAPDGSEYKIVGSFKTSEEFFIVQKIQKPKTQFPKKDNFQFDKLTLEATFQNGIKPLIGTDRTIPIALKLDNDLFIFETTVDYHPLTDEILMVSTPTFTSGPKTKLLSPEELAYSFLLALEIEKKEESKDKKSIQSESTELKNPLNQESKFEKIIKELKQQKKPNSKLKQDNPSTNKNLNKQEAEIDPDEIDKILQLLFNRFIKEFNG